MSNNKFQAKLTEEEIEAALQAVAVKISMGDFNEDIFERFTYLGKRLLKIKKGEVEIETETNNSENPAPTPPTPPSTTQTW